MWLSIEPASGIPIYQQIVHQIRAAVAGGFISPGEKLPSVRDLALQLEVNPNTVSRAYRQLETQGLVSTKRGVGTFISENLKGESLRQYRTELDRLLRQLAAAAALLELSEQELLDEVRLAYREVKSVE